MSAAAVSEDIRFTLSPAWVALASDDAAADVTTVEALEDFGLDPDSQQARSLARALERARQIVASLPPGARVSNALVRDPLAGRVDALLSFRVSAITEDAYDNYIAAATDFDERSGGQIVRHTLTELDLPVGRSVLVHHFLMPRNPGGVPDPATERTFLTVFPAGGRRGIEFTLLTQDLSLFDSNGTWLVDLISGHNPPTPGMIEA